MIRKLVFAAFQSAALAVGSAPSSRNRKITWYQLLISQVFILTFVFGTVIPAFASPVHPSGPENRMFGDRSIEFYGGGKRGTLYLAYPAPDEIVDWTGDLPVDVYGKKKVLLGMDFVYSGHYWEGVFGRVALDVEIKSNKVGAAPWADLQDLLAVLRAHQVYRNEVTKNEPLETRQEWLLPEISELNGSKCIRQYVNDGASSRELHFYFLFNKERAIDVKFSVIDNSNRPGLRASDWRSRADGFLIKLLQSTKFSDN